MRQIAIGLLILASVSETGTSHAQALRADHPAGTRAYNGVENFAWPAGDMPLRGYKSTRAAWAWALGSTLVPIRIATASKSSRVHYLGLAGFVLGPSAGNIYACDPLPAVGGAALRGFGTFLFSEGFDLFGEGEDGLVLFGAVFIVASMVWNIRTVPHSVARYNRRVRERVAITPVVYADSGTQGLRVTLKL